MEGYLLLADGLKAEGTLVGSPKTAIGWLVANTAVVGFQEMATDPTYGGAILTFTYPEVGNVGVAGRFSESPRVQVEGMVVKVLSEYRSHYLSEEDFSSMLAKEGVPCLVGIDTRAVAVHLREAGEMAAAIGPVHADAEALGKRLAERQRPEFRATTTATTSSEGSGPKVAVIDLGIRRSLLEQLNACCTVLSFPAHANAASILGASPAGVFISDGPATCLPPREAIETVRALMGRVPLLGCGLGHVTLGMAAGCEPAFLRRGHHGANYPVRNVADGTVEVTHQRHSVALDRQSVLDADRVGLLCENVNDETVEGILAADGSAVGLQETLAAPRPGLVNAHIERFVVGLGRG